MNLAYLLAYAEKEIPVAVWCHTKPTLIFSNCSTEKRYEVRYIPEKDAIVISNGKAGLDYNYALEPNSKGLFYLDWFYPIYK